MTPTPENTSPSTSTKSDSASSSSASRSVAFKLLAIAVLVLILLVPLSLLRGLISEREQLRESARSEVASKWGQEQILGGPVLTLPFEAVVGEGEEARTVQRLAHVLPERLAIDGELTTEERRRGIYTVVLYGADATVRGRFAPPRLQALGIDPERVRWDEAYVSVGVSDLTGIRAPLRLVWDDATLPMEPGLRSQDVFQSGAHVPISLDPAADGWTFALDVDLNGSSSLAFLPFGQETMVSLESGWSNPSFAGAFLPTEHEVSEEGFTATWQVLHYNRNYGQHFVGALEGQAELPERRPSYVSIAPTGGRDLGAFGVRLMQPADAYQKAMRAAKYGLLVVLLTFTTFFLVEALSARRVHPVQYLLVGLAVSIFYLLLLAFAEHVPFNAAYGLASVLVLAMVLLYTRAVLATWRIAGTIAGLLAAFYGFFFVLLQLDDYALLLGSIGLFVILSAVMYVSRQVDWYALGGVEG